MMKRMVHWWKGLTLNEKSMYLLIVALTVGIATRWRVVFGEAAEAFRHIFAP